MRGEEVGEICSLMCTLTQLNLIMCSRKGNLLDLVRKPQSSLALFYEEDKILIYLACVP